MLTLKAQTGRRRVAQTLEGLPQWAATAVRDELEEYVKQMAQADEHSRRLMKQPGIGSTTASVLLESIGSGHDIRNERQLSAWLGRVPGQYSLGGKPWLGRITKAGDSYRRTLLILGARSVLAAAVGKHDRLALPGVGRTPTPAPHYGPALRSRASKGARHFILKFL